MKHSEIPSGHYAYTFSNGLTRFFKVEQGKGKWAGLTFLKLQAGDEYHSVKDSAKRRIVLDIISQAPLEAATAYGKLIGHCSVCSRQLTETTSRELGIGPICRRMYS